ncbi:hypothetical protein L208DRAFT_1417263 [Tricholoma matsutake]|nr:hypothetical protein L208DRAFT_1417263 [Tricholoma matsutake 945]
MELKNKAWVLLPVLDGCINVLLPTLTESKGNIQKYFVKELEKIKQDCLSFQGPSDWPPKSSVHKLMEKSEGLFVYAAMAVRYIGGEGDPNKQLADILKLHKGLDPLYTQVIGEAKKWDYCDIIMGTLMHLQYPLTINKLSTVLLTYDNNLESNVIHSALGGCHSIMIILRDNTEIKFHHASLRDFLTDQSQSNTLFYTPAMSHGQLMVGCLRAITRSFSDGSIAPAYALISWHHHASLFLSALGANEGLGGLKDEAEELVKKIDLKWVKVWLVQALGESTQKKLHGLVKRDGAQVLEQKLRSISGILEKVSLSCDHFLKHNC